MNIQKAFFNRWKKHHGLKNQSIEAPCGLSMDLWGPMSFRNHDGELAELSEINDKIAEVQLGDEVFIYYLSSHFNDNTQLFIESV